MTIALSEFDSQLLTGIRLALDKARELGYEVESMDISASVADDVCSVRLTPIPPPGYVATGGDLSLRIDARTERIIECRRGQ